MTDDPPETDPDARVYALAYNERTGRVGLYDGPNRTEYPVRFDGLGDSDGHTIDNRAHKITSRLVGWHFYVALADTDDGAAIATLRDEAADADLGAAIEAALDVLDDPPETEIET